MVCPKPGSLCSLGQNQPLPISSLALNSAGCQTRSTNCGWRSISSRPGAGRSWRACTRGESLLPKPCRPVHAPLSSHTHVFRAFWFLGPQNAVGAGHFGLTMLAALSPQQICPGVRHRLLRTAQPHQMTPDSLSNDKTKQNPLGIVSFSAQRAQGLCNLSLSSFTLGLLYLVPSPLPSSRCCRPCSIFFILAHF